MYNRTPLRQISRLYSSLLELRHLPDTTQRQGRAMTEAVRMMAQQVSDALARSSAHSLATTQTLISRVSVVQPPTPSKVPQIRPEATASIPPTSELLFQFRRLLLSRMDSPLLCVDVGARWGADDALLLLKERAKLLCFDPDEEECARLQRQFPVDEVEYVPLALSSDGRELDLTITRQPACSSIFPPVEALYRHYPACEEMTPERRVRVPSVSLDQVITERGLGAPDLYKLDTQGSELDILRGAIRHVSQACMVDIEVQFNPLYHGALLFCEVDSFMRSQGFALWRLPQMVHYAPENFPAADTPLESVSAPPWRRPKTDPGNGQLFWGQAQYVKSSCLITDPQPIEHDFALRSAAIASAYGYWDLSLMVLEKCVATRAEASMLRTILTPPAIDGASERMRPRTPTIHLCA